MPSRGGAHRNSGRSGAACRYLDRPITSWAVATPGASCGEVKLKTQCETCKAVVKVAEGEAGKLVIVRLRREGDRWSFDDVLNIETEFFEQAAKTPPAPPS